MTDVEKVARAIYAVINLESKLQFGIELSWARCNQDHLRTQAKAAIAACTEALEQEVSRLRGALEWYGDEGNYEPYVKWGITSVSLVHADGGKRARQALGRG